jgi:hypothetical protein
MAKRSTFFVPAPESIAFHFKYRCLFVLLIFLFTGCKKNAGKYCPDTPELYKEGHYTDISEIINRPELMDTLIKYPGLKVVEVNVEPGYNNSYSIYMKCIVFYNRIPVIGDTYLLHAYYNPGSTEPVMIADSQNIRHINISVTPTINKERAQEIAEENIEFKDCALTRLGIKIFILNNNTYEYRLVYKVEAAGLGYPYVELDAHNGAVYAIDDGIRY